jgi:voltage-gated potassium channel
MRRARRWSVRIFALYVRTILWSFRWSLGVLAVAVLLGVVLYRVPPLGLSPLDAVYATWMALYAQPIRSPPETWYLELMCMLYPLLGVLLVGEGVVRLSLLLLSRQHGEKDWMKVMASTYRNHVVLCGLGHLGSRILFALMEAGADVVALEKDPEGRFVAEAKATGVPVLIRDMKDDQALLDAGVEHARCIIIATNDDMANLEVVLDARRFNPKIRTVLRMFDQQIADKLTAALAIDQAFSSTALAAPLVAALAQQGGVLASFPIGGVNHVSAEAVLKPGSPLVGRTVGEVEASHALRVLALVAGSGAVDSPPTASAVLHAGDRVVVHTRADQLGALLAAAEASAA